MATLAFSLAGQAVGGLVGGPFGAMVGRALGALAGSAVDQALFGDKPQNTPTEFRLQGSVEGGPIPRLYGWSRLSGNIIWATEVEVLDGASAGAKGLFGSADEDGPVIAASFAVALCEGEVHRLGRIWADGQPLETEGLTIRFYRGTEDQGVDSLIEAKQGAGAAPAYRRLCYLVFERLPIGPFGNRIPNIAVELCRVVGDLEPAITAITLIPGATEYGYDPAPRVRIVAPGVTANENAHLSQNISDWTCSLDELQALCPNLKHVSLVVAWFGDDLRCGECTIRPKVEAAGRVIEGTEWGVAGQTRDTAQVVSTHDGGPAYGGTPSDAAVLAAIADLTARGLNVTLCPFVLMDIPAGNALPNPHGGTGQPAYPWRGRITCHPAPGQPGSPDGSGAVAPDVAAFAGTAGDWGYRRMLLHYAQLAADAGGVDAFLLGSEMRGISGLRDGANAFPFVAELVALAGEVRAIVGPATKITYGADWSEFTGVQPVDAPGDKYFHLDPLWASPDVDAIGIDNYMPIADWRDGTDHLDAAIADTPYQPEYLLANIAGGEGYDWYYASDADRLAGVRTPITDGAYGEPWVWRYKDLVSWWSNAHHNRISGVRQASPTEWVPQSKPIWFTELGCAATDNGANQPNIFGDPKSSENGSPYFSSGAPDALQQRQFLRAHLSYWRPAGAAFEPANNPTSSAYAGRMLDPERIYLWTWDARPYPAFPGEAEVWRDSENHATGHWLTGRLGAAASDELVAAIAADYGIELASAEAMPPLLLGLPLEGTISARDAMAPVTTACGLSVRETAAGIAVGFAKPRLATELQQENLARTDRPLVSRRRPDPTGAAGQLALTFTDRERGYLVGTATAMNLDGHTFARQGTPLVLDLHGARSAAERLLSDMQDGAEAVEISLSPSAAALEAGDVIALEGEGGGPFEIVELRDAEVRRVTARAVPARSVPLISPARANVLAQTVLPRAMPLVVTAHLPPEPSAPTTSRLVFAASANPWPGEVSVLDELSEELLGRIRRPAHLGALTAALAEGPILTWDDTTTVSLLLQAGHLASATEAQVLAGVNRVAVLTDSGDWEVIGFANATLTAPSSYELSHLLRGQWGSDHAIGPAAAGNRVMVLDERPVVTSVRPQWLGESLDLVVRAGRSDLVGTPLAVPIDVDPALPLRPVQLLAERDVGTGDITFTWTRRSRADASAWGAGGVPVDFVPEAHRVTIFSGPDPVRVIETSSPTAAYAAAQQVADFGAIPASFNFTVAQLSAVLGPGHPGQGTFND